VIRGVDHFTNAARQVQIYKAMGWELPVFAHIPLIHGPDGAKLSKRHGAPAVEAYRAMGYLPAGLRNYLARLGWSHGDDEIFSTAQMIAWFDISDVNKAPARIDFAKLADVNGHYIRQSSDEELIRRIRDFLPEAEGGPAVLSRFEKVGWDKLATALPSLKTRAKTLKELVDGAAFLLAVRPLKLDEKAANLLDADGKAAIAGLLPALAAVTTWDVPTLEAAVRAYSEQGSMKLGKVAQPLRAALTGSTVSPPVFDVMAALGREEVLARVRDQAG
jgi:glutamyl-tRNA synthetase